MCQNSLTKQKEPSMISLNGLVLYFRTKLNVDAPNNTRQTFSNVDTLKVSKINTNSQPRVENESSNVRTYGDFTFDISGVTSKFSQALQAKLNEEPPSLAGMYGSLNNQEHYLSDHNKQNDGLTRSRADRIQAIRDTAATLQNRLKEEARKIQAQSSSTNKIESEYIFYNFCSVFYCMSSLFCNYLVLYLIYQVDKEVK